MKNFLTVYFAIALLCFSAQAEEPVLGGVFMCLGENKKGDLLLEGDLLAKVQSKYATITSLSANFKQDSFLSALDAAEESRGSVSFIRPGMMKWVYEVPEEQIFLVRENTVWLYQPVDNQVIKDVFSDMLLTDLPVGFLMGVGNLSQSFSVTTACRTNYGVLLKLASTNEKGKALKAFSLLVHPETFFPRGAEIKDEAGNVTSIIFENEKTNVPLSSSSFEPSFPSEVDMQDRSKGKV